MAAVDDLDDGPVRHLGHQRGDETLHEYVRCDHAGHGIAQQCRLAAVDDPHQFVLVVHGLPERPEHGRGRPDRRQPLAPDVTDDHADPVLRLYGLVQIASDLRPGLGREVHAGHA